MDEETDTLIWRMAFLVVGCGLGCAGLVKSGAPLLLAAVVFGAPFIILSSVFVGFAGRARRYRLKLEEIEARHFDATKR